MPGPDISRNQPCPCGSGKRYKHCCGNVAAGSLPVGHTRPAPRPTMEAASRCQESGRLDEAEALLRKILEQWPDDPEVLHRLGAICYKTRHPTEAFALFLRALDAGPWPDESMLGNLTPILETVFVGKTHGQAARLRLAYDNWKAGLAGGAPRREPLVSVVVPATGDDDALKAALGSVFAQSYGAIEVLVAFPERAAIPEAPLAPCPFPARLVTLADERLFALLNQTVRQARGEFIALLKTGDRFEPRRIEKMVEAVAQAGGEWGFSGFGLDPASLQSAESHDRRTRGIAALLESIRGYDTTGSALPGIVDALALHSNLFFSRKLFDALGGFAEIPQAVHKDFALRALLQAEPFFVEETLLNCRIAIVTPAEASAESEWTHAALRGFYAQAVTENLPANPYAPVMAAWGDHYIARVAEAKHLHLLPKAGIRKCLERAAARVAAVQAQGPEKLPGLDLVSFFGAEIGLADSARGIARSCQAGGIPFSARTVELNLPQMRGDRSMDPWLKDSCRHAAVVFHINPDALAGILPQLTVSEVANRYLIGYWYWETERMPEQWRYALGLLNEIWVATEFVAEAVRKFTDKPVIKIHPPFDVPAALPFTRADFGLDEGRFLFLFSFDFGSFSARKNPHAAIQAFSQAFPPGRDDVGLVVKSHGGAQHPEKLRELHALIDGDPRIRLIDRRMRRNEVFGLQGVCDAFVSLHRSEGLGLGLAECMAQGKAVIGTAYSGNLEFMNEHNSCLVDCRLVPIRPGEYLHDQPGVRWAEPDVGQAAAFMRRLADDKGFYARIAAAGQAEIRQRWNYAATAEAVRRRLGELGLL